LMRKIDRVCRQVKMCENVPTGTMLMLMIPMFDDQRCAKPVLDVPNEKKVDRVGCEIINIRCMRERESELKMM
jgi:hypothetical protein